jgi:hypothetical protein
MYAVFFYNFGFTKHFDVKEEAIKYAIDSGFECSVIGPDNQLIKTIRTL